MKGAPLSDKFYIVTSIPYANAKPHMGHTLDVLYGDVVARHYRTKGYDVILQAGIDENGQKIYQKAEENGVTPEEWLKKIRPEFLDFFKKLDISYDVFVNTSDQKSHFVASQEMWKRAQESGDIYKKKYKGLYCVGCECFKNPDDLVEGKCPDHQTVPEQVEEENYFFALSKYQDFLLDHFKKNPDFVYPKNSYNEALSMLERGLEDVSISRPKARLPWGVPVPTDPDHVMYVWFDALTNYLTALGFPKNDEKFKKYWPIDLEIVGKDNNRWHTLLWPAMLKSAGLALPNKVLVHYYILGGGGIKMSKTIGNVIDPVEIIDKYGVDAFRYFLLSKIPLDTDGAFDKKHFVSVYETEIGNDLGNLVQRTLSMINRYNVPVKYTGGSCSGSDCLNKEIESLEFMKAIEKLWSCVRSQNKYIEDEKPWVLAKNDPEKLNVVLSKVFVFLCTFSEKIYPFMPGLSENLKRQLVSLKPEPLFPRVED